MRPDIERRWLDALVSLRQYAAFQSGGLAPDRSRDRRRL